MADTQRVTTRSRTKAQTEATNKEDDTVAHCNLMYPVFCTVDIPAVILDEFIQESYAGGASLTEEGKIGAFAHIMQSTDVNLIKHGSRSPMKAFTSPFLGWSDDDIRKWMKKNKEKHKYLAELTFAIMDENTIKNKTLRVGHMTVNEDILLVDFWAHMHERVPLEMCTVHWEMQHRVGTTKVVDKKFIDNDYKDSSDDE